MKVWLRSLVAAGALLLAWAASGLGSVQAAATQPKPGRVIGVVMFDDKPAANVRVKLMCSQLSGCRPSATETRTDAAGHYAFERVQMGVYTVAANVPGTNAFIVSTVSSAEIPMSHSLQDGQEVTIPVIHLFRGDLALAAPARGASVQSATPLLQWKAYPNAARYEVNFRSEHESGPFSTTTTLRAEQVSATPDSALHNGSYRWSVRAYSSRGTKLAESESSVFNVRGQADPPAAVKLLAPTGMGGPKAGAGLAFGWTTHLQADAYVLRLEKDASAGFPAFRKEERVTLPSHTWDYTLPSGTYRWRVEAMKGSTLLSRSAETRFQVK